MANKIKARKCLLATSPSDWVFKVFLTCDNKVSVWFKHGQKVRKILPTGPGAYSGHGGVPAVLCLYPNTAGEIGVEYFDLACVWPYAGEWVHRFLYKKFPYILVDPPDGCGNCSSQCNLSADNSTPSVGDTVTFTVAITNTDGSATSGAAPEGSVTFSVDDTDIGTKTLSTDSPPSTNVVKATQTWVATLGAHTILASYTPTGGFSSTTCQMNLTVLGGGGA